MTASMDDAELIDGFLDGTAVAAFGPTLHVERRALKVHGWWPMAYRVSGRTVIVRDEEGPDGFTAPLALEAAMAARGLAAVGADLPAVTMLTYTNLDLGYAPWVLWSTDAARGEADLAALVAGDSSFQASTLGATGTADADLASDGPFAASQVGSDAGSEISRVDQIDVKGARRTAGAPSCLLLAVGLGEHQATALRRGLVDCTVEVRDLDGISPPLCVALLPTMVVVDATGADGEAFVAELHGGAYGGPIVAVTAGGAMLDGADATVDVADLATEWVELVQTLMG